MRFPTPAGPTPPGKATAAELHAIRDRLAWDLRHAARSRAGQPPLTTDQVAAILNVTPRYVNIILARQGAVRERELREGGRP